MVPAAKLCYALMLSLHDIVLQVLKLQTKDTVRIGVLNGQMCTAEVHAMRQSCVELACTKWHQPEPVPALHLLLAMPRPKVRSA